MKMGCAMVAFRKDESNGTRMESSFVINVWVLSGNEGSTTRSVAVNCVGGLYVNEELFALSTEASALYTLVFRLGSTAAEFDVGEVPPVVYEVKELIEVLVCVLDMFNARVFWLVLSLVKLERLVIKSDVTGSAVADSTRSVSERSQRRPVNTLSLRRRSHFGVR